VNCLASCDIEGLGKVRNIITSKALGLCFGIQLTEPEAEELLASLGIESDTGAGIAYDEVAPYVVNALM